jgi:hypothetical protein
MSRILKVSDSNYRVQVISGGNITLDVGAVNTGGTVTITGNLDVKGTTTQIESVSTTVNDNILQLNWTNGSYNGAGISSTFNYIAGIEIERGSSSAARFLYNEQVGWTDNTNGSSTLTTNGGFQVTTASSAIQGIQVSKIAANGINNSVGSHSNDLVFDLQGTTSILRVANYSTSGSNNYVNNAVLDNHIPTIGWVKLYTFSNYVPGSGNQGSAIVSSIQYPLTTGATVTASITATNNTLTTFVGTTNLSVASPTGIATAGYISANNVQVGANSTPNTITTIGTGDPRHVSSANDNLILTANNSIVEVTGVVQLDNQSWNSPAYIAGGTKIYSSSTIGPGSTGVYVTNSTVQTQDELISRRKAVLLSILL